MNIGIWKGEKRIIRGGRKESKGYSLLLAHEKPPALHAEGSDDFS
jgi:hypothetical protein